MLEKPTTKPTLEIQPSDPTLWEKEDQDSLVGLIKILLQVDMRNNPERYRLKPESLKPQANLIKQTNLKSYESNYHIRNSNSTSQGK
jgi:hypothetical protein